jgi:hypothetical protein
LRIPETALKDRLRQNLRAKLSLWCIVRCIWIVGSDEQYGRKADLLEKRQIKAIQHKAEVRGVNESGIIREAIDLHLFGSHGVPAPTVPDAWDEIEAFRISH